MGLTWYGWVNYCCICYAFLLLLVHCKAWNYKKSEKKRKMLFSISSHLKVCSIKKYIALLQHAHRLIRKSINLSVLRNYALTNTKIKFWCVLQPTCETFSTLIISTCDAWTALTPDIFASAPRFPEDLYEGSPEGRG